MNNKSIEAIKTDIISLLDNVNNVVGCQKAMDAIAKLEGCTMTREILEETRIGKYVNELRRKKKDDKALSKRIKSLVRKWQDVANEAGISLKQPLKKIPSTINGKHEYNSINSPQLPINGKLKNNVVEKMKGLDNKNSSSVKFIVSTPSPGLNYSSQVHQNIHTSNSPNRITSSPIVNSPSQSHHNSVTTNLLTKNNLSVINGYSNKLPTTPTTPLCDTKEGTLQKASKKRKAEALSPGSIDSVSSKKLKSSFNNGLEGSNRIKNKLENSLKNELYINESSNDSTFNRSQKNGFLNGDNYEDKVFSCNSTGNLKCTISRSRLVQTPPITPSFHSSPHTPINKQRSIATPPIPSSLIRSKTTSVKTKTVNTPPIQSSKLKLSNTPPIPYASQLSQKTLKKSATASTPLHETPKSLVKNSKVETTAQILQKLHSNNNLPLAQSLEKISSNRIKREKSDDDEISVVPESIKPRGNKRRSKLVPPQANAREVAQAKNERMQIFLHSSNLSSNNFNEVKKEDSKNQDLLNGNTKKVGENKLNETKLEDEEVDISKLDPNSAQYKAALLKNPWAFLPPIVNDDDDCGGKNSIDAQKEDNERNNSDIEERLNKLSLQKWSGVNGVEDGNGDFKDWTSSYSIKIDDEYRHILPYVCL